MPMAAQPVYRYRMANKPDTTPESTLRKRLHAHGLRFARSLRDLPGRPDLVLPKRRSVIFVRGCFWHSHGCALDRAAARFKTGTWAEKIAANRAQAERDQADLHAAGWQVETVWECQVDQPTAVAALVARLLQR
jgi:DNA mismatch endonuclease (patch repair protein)